MTSIKQADSTEATGRQAEANILNAQDIVRKNKPLTEKKEIPQQQYTQAVLTQRATAAAVANARSTAAAAENTVTQARARIATAPPSVKSTQTPPEQISPQKSPAAAPVTPAHRPPTRHPPPH